MFLTKIIYEGEKISRFDIDDTDLYFYYEGKEIEANLDAVTLHFSDGSSLNLKDLNTYEEFEKYFKVDGIDAITDVGYVSFHTMTYHELQLRQLLTYVESSYIIPDEIMDSDDYDVFKHFMSKLPACLEKCADDTFLLSLEDYDTDRTINGNRVKEKVNTVEGYILDALKNKSQHATIYDTLNRLSALDNDLWLIDETNQVFYVEDFDDIQYKYLDVCKRGHRIKYIRLNSDALFQVIGVPLYITKGGDLYLAYIDREYAETGYCGVLHYKINDIKEFKTIMARYNLLKPDTESNADIAAAFRKIYGK